MAKMIALVLLALTTLVSFDASNVLAQGANTESSAYAKPSLPAGFFPKYADEQTYAAQKVQRLADNPGYFKDKPDQIAEALAYLEFMIDAITRPDNLQAGAEERKKYLDMRTNLRLKIGIDANASPSVAIAALYTISKIGTENIKQGVESEDIGAILEGQGLTKSEVSSLTEMFESAGFELENVFSVGDAVSEIVSAAGLDSGIADSIINALGLEASTSFSDAVAAFNAEFGTSYTVDQAKEALGIGDAMEGGH